MSQNEALLAEKIGQKGAALKSSLASNQIFKYNLNIMSTNKSYRDLFPVTQNWTYVNHAAVGPLPKTSLEAVHQFMTDSSEHGYTAAPKWHALIARARVNVAKLIHASSSEEIAFTSSTSAGLAFVAQGVKWNKGDNLLIPDCEFPANVYPWLDLQKKGVEVRQIPTQNGKVLFEEIEKLADKKTRLISISSVQYGSGWIAPLKEIGEWCQANSVLFCVDGIQGCGAVPINVEECHIDFLAADAHKWLLGPEGTAFFYVSKRVWDQVTPSIIGWKSVQNPLDFDHIDFTLKEGAQKFEAGSDNVLGIHALNASLELLLEVGIETIHQKIVTLTQILTTLIEKEWPDTKLISPENPKERSGIVALKTTKDPNKLIEQFLNEKIYCATRRGFLRISPHFYNNDEEMELIVHKGKKFI